MNSSEGEYRLVLPALTQSGLAPRQVTLQGELIRLRAELQTLLPAVNIIPLQEAGVVRRKVV